MATEIPSTPEERAEQRVNDFTAVAWHVATYLIINVFLWLVLPPWGAFWISLAWGIGLAFHVAYYVIGDEGRANRRYRTYLAEERAKDAQDHG